MAQLVVNPLTSAGDVGLIPGLGRYPGEGNGNPLQYSCLENSMDRGTCWATVHGVAKSQTWLSMHTHIVSTFSLKIVKMKSTPIDRYLIRFYNSFPPTLKKLSILIKEYWKIKVMQRTTEVIPSTIPRGEQNPRSFGAETLVVGIPLPWTPCSHNVQLRVLFFAHLFTDLNQSFSINCCLLSV